MPSDYTTPPHLQPVELWRLRLATGEMARAAISPTTTSVAAVWHLDDRLQDAAEFQEREAAIRWAEDIRYMLTAKRWA